MAKRVRADVSPSADSILLMPGGQKKRFLSSETTTTLSKARPLDCEDSSAHTSTTDAFLFQDFRSSVRIDGDNVNDNDNDNDDCEEGERVQTLDDEELPTTAYRFSSSDECQDDQPTQSLLNIDDDDDDDDDDDGNTVDYFGTFVGSLTNEEKDEMMQGFESYMESHHNTNTDSSAPFGTANANANANANTGTTITTPASSSMSSLRKWLVCRSTSASVGGIYYNNGFEPAVHTLDGVRKNLFGE